MYFCLRIYFILTPTASLGDTRKLAQVWLLFRSCRLMYAPILIVSLIAV